MIKNSNLQLIAAFAGLLLASTGCGEDAGSPDDPNAQTRAVTLNFAGVIGDQAFGCGQSYEGIGATSSTLTLQDFRLYISDVRLVAADGSEVPVALDQETPFQTEDLALLDFEDGSGGCESGTAEINTRITGEVPEGDYTGLRFVLGVPFDLNHGDAALAPSPLNLSSMFWSWNGGYKFLRVDARSAGLPDGLRLHLGSSGCDMNGDGAVTGCANPNRPEVTLAAFDVDADTVKVDIAALLAGSDIDANAADTPPGCMSTLEDADCGPIFESLGLGAGPQTFFSVQ